MRIYNYIKNGICEPIAAETHKEADRKFIETFDIKIDEVQRDNDKEQFKFDFYIDEDMLQ